MAARASKGGSKVRRVATKLGLKKHRKPSASKRSEFRERSNLILSTASLGVGVASLIMTLNTKGDRMTQGAGSEGRVSEQIMNGNGQAANAPRLKRLTAQDIESSCRGKQVTRIVLKASGGNIGAYLYEPGAGEQIVAQWGPLYYWKKERKGDCLYYMLGN